MRSHDFQTKHIERQILARPFLSMYKLHKYWGRKPWNIFEQYIHNYSKEGQIVLDPFCGSGLAVAEALKLNRKAIAIDINPMATFITRQTVIPIDLLKFDFAYKDIVSEIRAVFCEEYITKCRSCKRKAYVIHYLWSREQLEKGVKITGNLERNLKSVRYFCEKCQIIKEDEPIPFDLQQAKKNYEPLIQHYLFKINPSIIVNLISTTRKSEASTYLDLFTRRNLFLLAVLYSTILKIEEKGIRDIMKLVFTSALEKSSRLLMFTRIGVKEGVRSKSWVAPRFHIQREYLEKNPLINFENSFVRVFRGKQESNRLIPKCSIGDSIDDVLSGKADVFITTQDSQFIKQLPESSVDYVIADPPFVKDIKYLELSQLWSNWLGYDLNWEKEIKFSSLKKPDLQNYVSALTKSLSAMHRVLKPDSFLTFIYHTENVDLWDVMAKCPVQAGFTLEKLVPQGVRYSYGGRYRTFMTRKTKKKAFIGHYYLTFSKSISQKSIQTLSIVDEVEDTILTKAIELVRKRNEATPFIFILMNLYGYLSSKDIIDFNVNDIIRILERSRHLEKDGTNPNIMWQKWYLHYPREKHPATSLIEQVREHLEEVLLFEKHRSTMYYIQGTLNKFTGSLMVSNQRVMNLLDELSDEAKGESNGRVLKNKASIALKIKSRIVENLIKLGKQYEYRSVVFREIDKNRKIARNRFEKLFFKIFSKEMRHNFRRLDLMWLKEDMPLILFQVILTEEMYVDLETANQLFDELATKIQGFQKVLVLPETLKETVLESAKIKEHWDYILIEELEMFLAKKGILERSIERETKTDNLKAKKLRAKVIEKVLIPSTGAPKYFKMVLKTNYIEKIAKAGQFINILCTAKDLKKKLERFDMEDTCNSDVSSIPKKVGYKNSPLLRRPISIHRIYYEKFQPHTLKGIRELPSDMQRLLHPGKRSQFDILVKVVGVGTKLLSMVKAGDTLDIIGPLGNWFSLSENLQTSLIVAGGIGIAPLYALAERLRWEGKKVILFFGGYDKTDLSILGYDLVTDKSYSVEERDIDWMLEEFEKLDIEIHVSTIIGKTGYSGTVTDLFEKYISEKIVENKDVEVFSCGPKGMLKALAKITKKYGLKHQVLMEEIMGCGVGACMSCVCPTKSASGYEYKRVCTDGPVFVADEVEWDVS